MEIPFSPVASENPSEPSSPVLPPELPIEERLKQALAEFRSLPPKSISQRKLALEHGVPASTLNDRINGKAAFAEAW